jgi:hypothetical protein
VLKNSAASLLALGSSLAFAQSSTQYNSPGGVMPPGGSYNAPNGANGSAPLRDVGTPSANATDTATGGTSSTTILSQSNKNQSAAGMPSSNYGQGMPAGQSAGSQIAAPAYGTQYGNQYGTQQAYGMSGDQGNPNRVCMTDEYGYKYNCRGDRIGGPRR